MELAARLREEARKTNERRLLVLAGTSRQTRKRAGEALAATDIPLVETTYVGPGQPLDCESVTDSDELLGTTHSALVVDCHERCEPNALGRLAGTVDGGGLLVLLVPPLEAWPTRRDGFDRSLAVPPFDIDDVGHNFREHLLATLRAHRGVAIVDVGTDTVETDGLTGLPPRGPRPSPEPPSSHQFPAGAYDACRTRDQVDALLALEGLREAGGAVVVEADRGRGKSSAAGLAAASLASEGKDVLVTAPNYRNCRELFARANERLSEWGERHEAPAGDPTQLVTETGAIRFCRPVEAATLPEDPDRVIVDEAAAVPVGILVSMLDAPGVAFTTTVHGYEGAGRGFTVRFRDRLLDSRFDVTDVTLTEPIRYAPGDPVEVWSFRALALDATPPVEPLVTEATPESVTYCELDPATLSGDERLLREVFGLLVLAHYRTEPNDLARLLDAPNLTVHALLADGHPVSVALLAREGGLPAAVRADMYEGKRVKGNMIPDVLASQLRDEQAGQTVGHRVLRIATHGSARSRGLGSALLARIREACDSDWLGVGYGATPRLVAFWRENGFRMVHLGTSRNDRSGEHSAIMLDPLSAGGVELFERHTDWFLRRFPGTLADSLSELDPDVVRAVCRGIAGTPTLELTDDEWRIAAGIPSGAAILSTAPRPVRRLTFRHLVDPAEDALTPQEERLLVRKTLQCQPWAQVSEELSFDAQSNCMRTLGAAVESLVELYGPTEQLERFR